MTQNKIKNNAKSFIHQKHNFRFLWILLSLSPERWKLLTRPAYNEIWIRKKTNELICRGRNIPEILGNLNIVKQKSIKYMYTSITQHELFKRNIFLSFKNITVNYILWYKCNVNKLALLKGHRSCSRCFEPQCIQSHRLNQ